MDGKLLWERRAKNLCVDCGLYPPQPKGYGYSGFRCATCEKNYKETERRKKDPSWKPQGA